MRKIGINMGAVYGLSAEDQVRTISELGFEATFTGMGSEQYHTDMAELFSRHGIAYETVHAPFKNINEIWKNNDDGERMCSQLMECADRCALVSVPTMVVHLSSGLTPPSITDIGRERFGRLVEHAKDKGVCVAFENQRKLANIAWAFEAFENEEHVGFCWDCGHEACFSPGREYMPLFGNRLVCLHIHDNYAVFDQDSHLIPFDGRIDYDRFANYIRSYGFGGSLMLEVFRGNNNAYGDISDTDYLIRARDAAVRLRGLVDGE